MFIIFPGNLGVIFSFLFISQNPKDAFAQLAAVQNQTTPTSKSRSTTETISSSDAIVADPTTFLLEGGMVSVGAEEVISEEIVTDEPVVVLEGEALSESKEPPVTTNIASGVEGLTSIVTVTTETTLSVPTVLVSSQDSLSPTQAAIASGTTVPSAVLQTEVTTSVSPHRSIPPHTVIARPLHSSSGDHHLSSSPSTDLHILTPSSMAHLIAETIQGEMAAVTVAHASSAGSTVLTGEDLSQMSPKIGVSVSDGLAVEKVTAFDSSVSNGLVVEKVTGFNGSVSDGLVVEKVTGSVSDSVEAATLPMATVVTEEVVISEPIIETIVCEQGDAVDHGQVMVIMEEGPSLSVTHTAELTTPLEEEFSAEWGGISMIATSADTVDQDQEQGPEESDLVQHC